MILKPIVFLAASLAAAPFCAAHNHDHTHDHAPIQKPFELGVSGVLDLITTYSDAADRWNITARDVELEVSAEARDIVRAWVTINAHSPLDPTGDHGFLEHAHIELEEAAIMTTGLPWGLTLKGGQFFADFTLYGKVHGHDLPFVDRPYSLDLAIGGETIARGVELHWVPEPVPQLRFVLGVVDGMGEQAPATNRLFISGEEAHGHAHGGDDGVYEPWQNRAPRDVMGYGRAEAHLEPTPFTNLDLGLNYAHSGGSAQRQIASADVRFRWQPNGLKPDELEFGAEAIWSRQHGPFSATALAHREPPEEEHEGHGHEHEHDHDHAHDEESSGSRITSRNGSSRVAGGYAWLQYRIGKHWVPGVRVDYTEASLYELSGEQLARFTDRRWTWSTYVTFHASDWQRFRLQLSYVDAERPFTPSGGTHDVQAFLQWTILLGGHNHP